MNLLFLEEHPQFIGGSERMSLTLCRHAIARGHRASLVHASDGDMVPAYRSAGARCERLPVTPAAIRRPAVVWQSLTHLAGTIRRHAIDVVFTSQVNYVSLLAAVGQWTRVPTVVHLGLTYDYPSPLFRMGTRMVSLGVVPSEHTADGWRQRQWPAKSLRVIPNAVDTITFHPADGKCDARRALGLPHPEQRLVVYVGRLVREKGIFTLLRAFAAYRREGGTAFLMLVGRAPADEVRQLRALAAGEGLSDAAWEIRESTPAPELAYRAADLLVAASEWDEPFGLVPLEAMACGTLAIVSDRGVLPQFVAPIGADATVPAGNVDALKARLIDWLSDDERRERAATQAMAFVRSQFGFARCGDAYLSAFEDLRSH